jgi:hypothetical protein
MSLITRERAIRNLRSGAATTTTENKLLDSFIVAASDWIEKYCRRTFTARQYDELYDGCGERELYLRQFPVLSVERVAYAPETVLEIENTSGSNQRATVTVTDTGLTLIRVASGTTTTDTSVTFASNATITALKTAINALGNGWSATIPDSDYANWPSADLRPQGAFNAVEDTAELTIHTSELAAYDLDAARGLLTLPNNQGFGGGRNYWRVKYTAGFSSVPEAVQEACAEIAVALFWQAGRDPGLAQEQIPTVVSRTPVLNTHGLQPHVKKLLAPYRKYA